MGYILKSNAMSANVKELLGQRSSNFSVEGFPIIGSQFAIIEWDLMNLIEMAALMCIMDG